MGLCPKHADQCLHVLEKSSSWFEWFHVDLVSLDGVILVESPYVLHKCIIRVCLIITDYGRIII